MKSTRNNDTNVLVVSSKYPPEYGGSGHRAHKTYKRLADKYNVQFDVICGSVNEKGFKNYRHEGVRVKQYEPLFRNRLDINQSDTGLKRFLKIILDEALYLIQFCWILLPVWSEILKNHRKYDVVHVFGRVDVTAIVTLYSKIFNKPLIAEWVNVGPTPDQYFPRLIRHTIGKRYTENSIITCLSEEQKNRCLSQGYDEEKVWVKPNPIDENKFSLPDKITKRELRQELTKFDESDIILLYLAKFKERKNQKFLVNLMENLSDVFKLLLVGPAAEDRATSYYEQVEEQVSATNQSDRIQLIPEYTEIPEKYMKASDIFLFPAWDEAFGTVFAEAIACGLPVVANNEEVFQEWIVDGENGFCVPLKTEKWLSKIRDLSTIDRDKRSKMSKEILAELSMEVIDEKYFYLLTKMKQSS